MEIYIPPPPFCQNASLVFPGTDQTPRGPMLVAMYGRPYTPPGVHGACPPTLQKAQARMALARALAGGTVASTTVEQRMVTSVLAAMLDQLFLAPFDADGRPTEISRAVLRRAFGGMPMNSFFGDPAPGMGKILYCLVKGPRPGAPRLVYLDEYDVRQYPNPVQDDAVVSVSQNCGGGPSSSQTTVGTEGATAALSSTVLASVPILQRIISFLPWRPDACSGGILSHPIRHTWLNTHAPRRLTIAAPDPVLQSAVTAVTANPETLSVEAARLRLNGLVCSLARSLTQLSLTTWSQCPEVDDDTAATVARTCKQLCFLSLNGCRFVSDAGLAALIHDPLPRLESLHLKKVVPLSDATLAGLTASMPSLLDLDLSGCTRLTDTGLGAVANNLRRLQILHLKDCHQVTDDGVLPVLLRHQRHLKLLSLWGLHKLSEPFRRFKDAAEAALAASAASAAASGAEKTEETPMLSLRSLNLWGCHALSDDALHRIQQMCPGLLDLNCRYLMRLTDNALLNRDMSSWSALHHLNLRQCWKLTDAAVAIVARACKQLVTLDLSRLPKLTAGGVGICVAELKNMTELRLLGNEQFSSAEGASCLLDNLLGFPMRGMAPGGNLDKLDCRLIGDTLFEHAQHRLGVRYTAQKSSGMVTRTPQQTNGGGGGGGINHPAKRRKQ